MRSLLKRNYKKLCRSMSASDNSEDETYDSPEQIEEYRMTSRKQILQNRMENSYVRKSFTGLLRMDQFYSRRHSKKGSSLLASLQKYLQTHVEYAESQGQYRTADNIYTKLASI